MSRLFGSPYIGIVGRTQTKVKDTRLLKGTGIQVRSMKFQQLEIMEIYFKNSKIRFKYEMEFCLQTACFHKSFAVISFLKESFDFFSSSNTDKRRTSLWDRKQAHFGVLQEARAFGKEDPARHPATRIDSGKGMIPAIWYGFLSSLWRCVKIKYNSEPCMKWICNIHMYTYINVYDRYQQREREIQQRTNLEEA